jgi:uncharacterized alkaline shock family protein YloU
MAETGTGDATSTPSSTPSAGQRLQRGLAQADSSAVVVDQKATQGKTTIADGVVAKIVGIAAREIDGVKEVVNVGAGASIAGLATRVTGGGTRAQGVSVEVGEREAAASINIVVVYGVSIPQVADAVRRNIIDRVEAMTGLTVIAVDIAVTDLYFPEEETEQQHPRVQ